VLLNSNRRPADDEAIELIAVANATRPDKQIPHVSVRTDPNGRFTFAFIAPGRYLVGVNLKTPRPRPKSTTARITPALRIHQRPQSSPLMQVVEFSSRRSSYRSGLENGSFLASSCGATALLLPMLN
jgi:hypothetical protein